MTKLSMLFTELYQNWLYSLSYNDRIIYETVGRVSRTQVLGFINQAVNLAMCRVLRKVRFLLMVEGGGRVRWLRTCKVANSAVKKSVRSWKGFTKAIKKLPLLGVCVISQIDSGGTRHSACA